MKSPQMTIRQADRGDAPALSALATETYVEAFGHSFSADDLTAHLARYLSVEEIARMLEEDTFLIAETADRMIGFAQFGKINGHPDAATYDCELRRLYVHADFQNHGIGARMMEAALAHPIMQGAAQVILDVWEHNPAAQRFYARYGFEVIGAREFVVASGAETSLDLIMARPGGSRQIG